MVIRGDFVLRQIAGEYVLVPTGMAALDFGSLISTNGVGYFIWKQLQTPKTMDELVDAVVNEFDVDAGTARTDTEQFVEQLRKHRLVEE